MFRAKDPLQGRDMDTPSRKKAQGRLWALVSRLPGRVPGSSKWAWGGGVYEGRRWTFLLDFAVSLKLL